MFSQSDTSCIVDKLRKGKMVGVAGLENTFFRVCVQLINQDELFFNNPSKS